MSKFLNVIDKDLELQKVEVLNEFEFRGHNFFIHNGVVSKDLLSASEFKTGRKVYQASEGETIIDVQSAAILRLASVKDKLTDFINESLDKNGLINEEVKND